MKAQYTLTDRFPAKGKYGLVLQINRAAISVASNIAEGSGRTGRKDQAHFTQLAYGLLMEVACQMEIATDLGFIGENDLQPVLGAGCKTFGKIICIAHSAVEARVKMKSTHLSSLITHQYFTHLSPLISHRIY